MNRIDLYITDFCNLKCRHCYMEECERKQLTLKQIKLIIANAERDYFNGKIQQVNLLGGEQTIHKDFEEIINYLYDNNYKIGISTNGYFIKNIDLRTLKKIDYIQISCECLNKELLDSYRGNGYYDNLVSVTQYLKQNNIPYGYKFLVAKDTIPYLEETINVAKKLGASKISGARFIPTGNGVKNKENDLTKEELQQAYTIIFNAMIKNNMLIQISDGVWYAFLKQQLGESLTFKGCAVLNGGVNVVASGDILLCRKINLSFGNILKNDNAFKLIKQHPLYKKLTNRELEGKCNQCKHKYQCGGCRAYAFVKHNNILNEDELCFISD